MRSGGRCCVAGVRRERGVAAWCGSRGQARLMRRWRSTGELMAWVIRRLGLDSAASRRSRCELNWSARVQLSYVCVTSCCSGVVLGWRRWCLFRDRTSVPGWWGPSWSAALEESRDEVGSVSDTDSVLGLLCGRRSRSCHVQQARLLGGWFGSVVSMGLHACCAALVACGAPVQPSMLARRVQPVGTGRGLPQCNAVRNV
jgi:hypothetical protein